MKDSEKQKPENSAIPTPQSEIKQVPIIALTAHASREDEQKSLDAGCTAHLTKPIKKAKLMETILKLGHSMRGAGGGYGFDAITDIGRSLENAAKEKDSEEIRKWISELQNYLQRVEVLYE